MKILLRDPSVVAGHQFAINCPFCNLLVTFNRTGAFDLLTDGNYFVGLRSCPNPECHGIIFFIMRNMDVLQIFPHGQIRFNAEKVPALISDSMREAIACYENGNYRASSFMIRKSVELLCKDKNVPGVNLFDRIESLKKIITLPEVLLNELKNLRILSNDAANVNAEVYDNITAEETVVGIEFTKKIIESVYQFDDLLLKLNKLKEQDL